MPDRVREPRARRNTVGGGGAAWDRDGSALHMAPADGRRAKRRVDAAQAALCVSGDESGSRTAGSVAAIGDAGRAVVVPNGGPDRDRASLRRIVARRRACRRPRAAPGPQRVGGPVIALASGLRVYLACGVTDMRNYVEPTIMRCSVGLTEAWTGACECITPHNLGPLSAAEHSQELVRRSEPSGPEVRCRGGVQRLQFFSRVGPQIGLRALKASVTKP